MNIVQEQEKSDIPLLKSDEQSVDILHSVGSGENSKVHSDLNNSVTRIGENEVEIQREQPVEQTDGMISPNEQPNFIVLDYEAALTEGDGPLNENDNQDELDRDQEETNLEIISIEKQKKKLQLEILELERIEMEHKMMVRSNRGKRSQKSNQSRVGPNYFQNRQSIQNETVLNEESDIVSTPINRRKNQKMKLMIRYPENDSDTSFEYFSREQISDSYQKSVRQIGRRTSNSFENTQEHLLINIEPQMAHDQPMDTIQIPTDHQIDYNTFAVDNRKRTPNFTRESPQNQPGNRKAGAQRETEKIRQSDYKREPSKILFDLSKFEQKTPKSNINQRTPNSFEQLQMIDIKKSENGVKPGKIILIDPDLDESRNSIIIRNDNSENQSQKIQKSYEKKSSKTFKRSREEGQKQMTSEHLSPDNQVSNSERVPPPPYPQAFKEGNMAAGGTSLLHGGEDDESGAKKPYFFEPISYKKLIKMIGNFHPINQESKEHYSIKDRITIKNYQTKLSDACLCYAIRQNLRAMLRYVRQRLRGKKQVKFVKPDSMADMPDTNSSEDSDAEENNGITDCSLALGDGATLYLQMMKTFSIMFLILSFLNIPLFVLYEQNTQGNDMRSIGQMFKYFTIGNLGQLTKKCGSSNFHWNFDHDAEDLTNLKVSVDCEAGYIGEIQQFGFLYTIDRLYGGESEGESTCNHIVDPVAPYKKPILVPIVCSEEELQNQEYDLCLVDQQKQSGILNHLDADQAKRVIINSYLPIDQRVSDEIINQPLVNPHMHEIWNGTELGIELPPDLNTEKEMVDVNIDPMCLYDPRKDGKKSSNLWYNKESFAKFNEYYSKNCFYKSKCVLDPVKVGFQKGDLDERGVELDDSRLGLFGLISDDCKMRMSDPRYLLITSQIYIGVFGCKYDDVKIPFSKVRLHKEVMGIIIVAVDFTSILIMIYFFSKINILNNEFLSKIDDLRVQMKDFGVKINNVKLDKFTQDSRIVKLKIWLYFRELLEHNKDKYNDMECIDVCLSLYTQPSIQCVFRMQEIQLDINSINNKLYTNQIKEDQIPDKQEELKTLLAKQKRFEVRYKQLVQRPKVDKDNQNLTVTRQPKSQRINEIQYIFVVFKNCETREVVLEKFKSENGAISLFRTLFPSEDATVTQTSEQKMLFGRKIDVEPNLEPDEIIWENLAYTGDEQKARKLAINIFSIIFLLFNTLFTMYLSGFSGFMNKEIPEAIGCPDVEVTKREAFVDAVKGWDNDPDVQPVGLLGCYCKAETSLFLPWTIIRHDFSEFSDINVYKNGSDHKNYCLEWWGLQYLKKLCLFFVSTSAVFINEIVAGFFLKLGQFQKKHTKVEEQTTCFRQIFTQEYINMGIIILIQSFDRLGITKKILGKLQSNNSVYNGFEPNWYMTFGNKVCIMIFMSSFLVNSKDIGNYCVTVVQRFRDRKYKMNIKLDPEDEDCDLPNTRIRIQSELEKLYTGKVFKGEKAYSRMMSTMFVILMFSSGMPILYLTGFVFYIVTYSVNKFLLINYYQKSRTLTRTIPLFTMEYLKYGILLHLAAACLMLTNKLAFITKDRSSGVDPLYTTQLSIDKIETDLSASDQSEAIDSYQDRFQFFHQQLFFTLLGCLIFGYFIGRQFFNIMLFIASQFFKLSLVCFNRVIQRIQERAKLILDKTERDKKKMQDALKSHMDVKVFKQLMHKSSIKESKESPAQEKLNELNHKLEGELDEENKIKIRHQILLCKIQIQQELKKSENLPDNNLFKDEYGDTYSEDQQFKNFKDKNIALQKHAMQEQQRKDEAEVKRELQKKRLLRPDYSDNILGELSTENLSNFYERSTRELHDFWEIFQYNREISQEFLDPESTSDYRTLFLETLYTFRISVEECVAYQSFLIQRIKDVETIIDKYFDLIIPTLIIKMKEQFDRNKNRRKKEGKEGTLKDQVMQRKYEEWFVKYSDEVQFHDDKYYSYKRKMKILVDLQDELINADKNRKENRQGIQDVCRMTGSLSQSYFIFDAQQFKVGRKIYYGIEMEDEVVDELGDLGDSYEHDNKLKTQKTKRMDSSYSFSDESDGPKPSKKILHKASTFQDRGKKSKKLAQSSFVPIQKLNISPKKKNPKKINPN